jgi:muconate cycloisomerase
MDQIVNDGDNGIIAETGRSKAQEPVLQEAVHHIEAGKIAEMSVFLLNIPVKTQRGHGSGTVADKVSLVVVKLIGEDGNTGWGEAAPWSVFTGTAEAAFSTLTDYLKPVTIGADPARISEIMARADKQVVGQPEAKAALETALFDLLGRTAGLPVTGLLGGRCRDRIALSFSIANPDFDADLALVRDLWDQGLRLFKVKTGFAGHDFDLDRLERLRHEFPEMDLRVDYNQGLASWQAIARLRDIETFKPTFIEQPVPGTDREAMAEITRTLDVPILADESVFGPEDAFRAARDRIADLFSVKIMKTGGLRRAQQVAAIGQAAGIACYGGDMFESGLAHLAGTHMIAATPNISLGCEFYQARWYLEQDILAEPFPVENGEVIVPQTPGLGIVVDEDRIRHFAVETREGGC